MHNRGVVIDGTRLRMVPYLPHHVPRYHEWMQDPYVLSMTCSEPLTLAEEEANQVSWLESSDKITFIILAPRLDDSLQLTRADTPPPPPADARRWQMVGDCNAFVGGSDDVVAEVEVSVSEAGYRRLGIATEAVRLLMSYLALQDSHRCFEAKILEANEGSVLLFRDKLGFSHYKDVPVFNEVHYRFDLPEEAVQEFAANCGYRISNYTDRETIEGPHADAVAITWGKHAERLLSVAHRVSSAVARGTLAVAAVISTEVSEEFLGGIKVTAPSTGETFMLIHSRCPNVICQEGHLVATCDIQAGQHLTLNAALCRATPMAFPFPDAPFSSLTARDSSETSPVSAEAAVAALPRYSPLVIGRGICSIPREVLTRWMSFADPSVRRAAYALGYRPTSSNPTIDIRGDSSAGYLTYAAVPIPTGTVLWSLRGVPIPFPTVFTLELGPSCHVLFDSDAQCMAHLCHPNLRIDSVNESIHAFDVVALRDIAADELIGFDYNTTEWSMREPFTCCCCPDAPQQVQGFNHLPPARQRALLEKVAPWVRRRFIASTS